MVDRNLQRVRPCISNTAATPFLWRPALLLVARIKRGGVLMLTHREDNCSKIGPSLFRRRAARAISRHPVILVAAFAEMSY